MHPVRCQARLCARARGRVDSAPRQGRAAAGRPDGISPAPDPHRPCRAPLYPHPCRAGGSVRAGRRRSGRGLSATPPPHPSAGRRARERDQAGSGPRRTPVPFLRPARDVRSLPARSPFATAPFPGQTRRADSPAGAKGACRVVRFPGPCHVPGSIRTPLRGCNAPSEDRAGARSPSRAREPPSRRQWRSGSRRDWRALRRNRAAAGSPR